MLAASGGGALVAALVLPRVLDAVADRTVMTTGAVALVIGATSAVTLSATDIISWAATGTVWILIGGGMALIITPTGRVLRRSVDPDALPEVFAAQFSLSHVAWLITYPIAGWIGTTSGFTLTWSILAVLTAIGSVAALALWPREAEAKVAGEAGAREVESSPPPPFATLLGDETRSAAGTLAACQCTCVRPV
jgi:hypothetical protein